MIVLLGGENWKFHRSWVLFSLVAVIGSAVWYFVWGMGRSVWPPGGSSLPGFTFGVVGGVLIVFEMLIWWRKKVRAWRIGKTQVWMRAHIWLGLVCLPLLILHSGFRLGGTLSTILLSLLVIVIASGIFGLVVQQFLPTRMLHGVPSETIYSQIQHVARQFSEESNRLVIAVCGPDPEEAAHAPVQTGNHAAGSEAPVTHLTIGAVRAAGKVQGKVLQTRTLTGPIAGSEPLRKFFRDSVQPFLSEGSRSGSPLAAPGRADALFRDLRSKLDPAAHDSVAALENLCEQRRQLDLQARVSFWLHGWLWIHLPLSVALVALMICHIWVALKYW
jgi:hypothetical protein